MNAQTRKWRLVVLVAVIGSFCTACGNRTSKDREMPYPGMVKYYYRTTDGGPHILLPSAVSRKWKGHMMDILNPLDPKSDYGRACGIQGKWGVIDVGGCPTLVLADPPLSACGRNAGGDIVDIFVLQGWETDEYDVLLDRACAQTAPDSFTDTQSILRFDEPGAILLFAGDEPGRAVYGESPVSISAGAYQVLTARYKGAGVEEVDIYRLKKIEKPQSKR